MILWDLKKEIEIKKWAVCGVETQDLYFSRILSNRLAYCAIEAVEIGGTCLRILSIYITLLVHW